jgi:hypothetical protein
MSLPTDHDALIESLREDLKAQMAALNMLHHPVYAGDPRRIGELEARIEQIRAAIAARKRELAAGKAA